MLKIFESHTGPDGLLLVQKPVSHVRVDHTVSDTGQAIGLVIAISKCLMR